MTLKNFGKKQRLFLVSPWLSTAAIGLLTLIIVIFTVNNLQREKRHLTDVLLRKGQDLATFVGAGSRAAMMMGMQSGVQTQQLIEQAVEAPGIEYIIVFDKNGVILSHNDPDRIGATIDRDMSALVQTMRETQWQIISKLEGNEKIFEVIRPFQPFQQRYGRFRQKALRLMQPMDFRGDDAVPGTNAERPDSIDRRHNRPDDFGQEPFAEHFRKNDWCQQLIKPDLTPDDTAGYIIVIGLEMTELEEAIKRNYYQIFFLAIVLLLVGLGGWLSLLAAQGYRITQQTLSHIQAFTGLLISKLPIGIIATGRDSRITTFNKTVETITGIDAKAAINRKPQNILPSLLADFFEKPGENEEIIGQERQYPLADSSAMTLLLSSIPIHDNDNVFIGRCLLIHDLTPLRKLEKDVRRHERLAALGKMAAGVAHEVRNPLSSIKGFATLIAAKFHQGSAEEEASRLLINEVERLNRSITELLNYSRPLPLNLAPVQLDGLIERSLALMRLDALELQIRLHHKIPPDLPPVLADADRLNQVLLNLYLNAFQAMPQGGTLTVAATRGKSTKTVQITVQDTGVGIPKTIIDKIMDPYFTTKPEGTGLGLAIVQKIIEEHGGSIRVTSQEGVGTRIIVTLPAA